MYFLFQSFQELKKKTISTFQHLGSSCPECYSKKSLSPHTDRKIKHLMSTLAYPP